MFGQVRAATCMENKIRLGHFRRHPDFPNDAEMYLYKIWVASTATDTSEYDLTQELSGRANVSCGGVAALTGKDGLFGPQAGPLRATQACLEFPDMVGDMPSNDSMEMAQMKCAAFLDTP